MDYKFEELKAEVTIRRSMYEAHPNVQEKERAYRGAVYDLKSHCAEKYKESQQKGTTKRSTNPTYPGQ